MPHHRLVILGTGPAGLTEREVEVLRLIARGASARRVADALGISPKTAGTHIERIYGKIGASTRSTATLFAMQQGLLDSLELHAPGTRPDTVENPVLCQPGHIGVMEVPAVDVLERLWRRMGMGAVDRTAAGREIISG